MDPEVQPLVLNQLNHVGYTPLLLAARHGHAECLAELVCARCVVSGWQAQGRGCWA